MQTTYQNNNLHTNGRHQHTDGQHRYSHRYSQHRYDQYRYDQYMYDQYRYGYQLPYAHRQYGQNHQQLPLSYPVHPQLPQSYPVHQQLPQFYPIHPTKVYNPPANLQSMRCLISLTPRQFTTQNFTTRRYAGSLLIGECCDGQKVVLLGLRKKDNTYTVSFGRSDPLDGIYQPTGTVDLWATMQRCLNSGYGDVADMGERRKPDIHINNLGIWIGYVHDNKPILAEFIPNDEFCNLAYFKVNSLVDANACEDPKICTATSVDGKQVHVNKTVIKLVKKAIFKKLI